MLKIDVFNHLLPVKFFERLNEINPNINVFSEGYNKNVSPINEKNNAATYNLFLFLTTEV